MKPDDFDAGICPFVSGPCEVWAADGAVMSGLLGVRTGIIEQRVADRGSWHWEQADVAIMKKYTSPEINI